MLRRNFFKFSTPTMKTSVPPLSSPTTSRMMNSSSTVVNPLKSFLKKYWFMLSIPTVVVGSIAFPQINHPTEGILQSAKWRDYLIPTMFFASGLSVPVSAMMAAISNVRAHSFIQISSLVLVPLMSFAFVSFLEMVFSKIQDQFISSESPSSPLLRTEFSLGMIFTGCIPTTIGLSTAVATALKADVPLTIVNSVLGNILGIIVTPLMFIQLTNHSTSMDTLGVIKKLSISVVLPLLVGLFFRARIVPANLAATISPYLGPLTQCCILTFLSTVVSQHSEKVRKAFDHHFGDVVVLFCSIIAMYTFLFHATLFISRFLPFLTEQQRISSLLSGTQKTAAMGVSMIALLFKDDPMLPLITMPLLMYHPSQVLLSAMFSVNAVKRGWMKGFVKKENIISRKTKY